MPDDFLRLTFDGGRFAGHAAPVEVLKEFSTIELLIKRVARSLYLDEHAGRNRVVKGFYAAGSLYITSSEANCFSATLARPGSAEAVEEAVGDVFARARDICLAALEAVASDSPLPSNFPPDEMQRLAEIGTRLVGEERLVLIEGPRRARVDQETRGRLAARMQRPLEQSITLDGEIESVIDEKRRYFIRTREGRHFEASFTPAERTPLIEAQAARPLVRLVTSAIVSGDRIVEMQEPELVEIERMPEIQKMHQRLETFSHLREGWAHGTGVAPDADLVERAYAILARALVESDKIPLPSVFPTPDGGIQAEWLTEAWAAEVRFAPQSATVHGQSTRIDDSDDADDEHEFDLEMPNVYEVSALVSWLELHFRGV
jgi:hypothetical protein